MAGHSKWANIQQRKGRQDAKRANLWTKLVREIIVAARMGGGDPESNSRLRLALIKARGGKIIAVIITLLLLPVLFVLMLHGLIFGGLINAFSPADTCIGLLSTHTNTIPYLHIGNHTNVQK